MTTNFYTITLDDDPIIHKIIAKISGLTSLPFTCPNKLLARAESYQPTAVFCDIHLGENISGLDFISQMRQVWQHVPILVMTSDVSTTLIGDALALGANDFLRKPLEKNELIGRMQARLNEMNSFKKINEFKFGDLVFNKALKTVQCNEMTSYLPSLESILFEKLVQSDGLATPKQNLKGCLWGKLVVSDNALDRKISSIRGTLRELNSDVKVKSIYGQGVVLDYEKTENK